MQKDSKTKQNILILDTDSQDSITKILELEERINPNIKKLVQVEYIESSRVSRFLKRYENDYDLIFIDIPRMTSFQKDAGILTVGQMGLNRLKSKRSDLKLFTKPSFYNSILASA